MLLRLVFFAIVFATFVGIGIYIWYRYKLRKVFFQNILDFCGHVLVEISFSKSTIRHIIDKYGKTYNKNFRDILHGYQNLLDGKQDITRERIDQLLWKKLKSDEQNAIIDFFYELGRHGVEEERQKIENKKKQFDTFFIAAEVALKRDASIYLKIFIILGIAAVILLL